MKASGSDPAWIAVGMLAVAALLLVVTAVVTRAPWSVTAAVVSVAAVTAAVVWTLASNPARRLGFGAVEVFYGNCSAHRLEETDEHGVTREFLLVQGKYSDSKGVWRSRNEFVVPPWVWQRVAAGRSDNRYMLFVVARNGRGYTVLAVLPQEGEAPSLR